jgi:hypothetical protein
MFQLIISLRHRTRLRQLLVAVVGVRGVDGERVAEGWRRRAADATERVIHCMVWL